jgi:hypothetical protein
MKTITDESLEKSQEERIRQFEEKKKNYKGLHCCLIMDYNVNKSSSENVSPCFYNPKFREYYLQETRGKGSRKINFCPYCGTKLPQDLSDLWFDILEKELGLDPWIPKQRKKIPADFLTDEWWKKRGL